MDERTTPRLARVSNQRDGWCVAAARRSPRGTVTSACGVAPTAARKWRWATSARSAELANPAAAAVGVAEQRVDLGGWRQEAVGTADDDDQVDVETAGAGQRADVHAVADLAVAGRRDLQLGDERRPELGPGDRLPDRVEVGKAVEHLLGQLPGRPLGALQAVQTAPTEPPIEPLVRPRHPVRPRPFGGRVTERRPQLGDEDLQGLRRLAVGGAACVGLGDGVRQVAVPVALADDPRPPPDALPPRRRDGATVGVPGGDVAEQGHQGGAPEAAPVELEQVGQQPRHHPLVGARAGAPVPRHARRRQLVLHHAGVRPCRRPQHRHAVEPRPTAGAVEHGAHAQAHLVIGIRGRHHVDRSGGANGRRRRRRVTGELVDQPDDRLVGDRLAGQPDDQLDRAAAADGRDQLAFQRPQSLRQVDDDPCHALRQRGPRPGRRGGEQVALVVPGDGQAPGHLGDDRAPVRCHEACGPAP